MDTSSVIVTVTIKFDAVTIKLGTLLTIPVGPVHVRAIWKDPIRHQSCVNVFSIRRRAIRRRAWTYIWRVDVCLEHARSCHVGKISRNGGGELD